MRIRLIALSAALAFVMLMTTFAIAPAAEPRPWLCRDKPVFSSAKPMRYEASSSGVGRWLITFMKFDPGSAHDGFSIVASQPINASVSSAQGSLESGQYFVVALYRSGGGHWICPGYARERDEVKSGVVSTLCYGRNSAACDVRLTVLPADGGLASGNSSP